MRKLRDLSAQPTNPEWHGVGDRLATLRAAFHQSQRDVAAETNWVHTTVSRLEREESMIDLPQLVSLAKHFNVELGWLATGKGPLFHTEHDGIIFLGSTRAAQPCRAAVELMLSRPPGQCVLLEALGTETERYGWALQTDNAAILILPGEVKPGFAARALVDFALNGWVIRGSFDIHRFGKDTLALLERKAVPASVFQQWFTLTPHQTDLADVWQLGSPPALVESVRPIFERLSAQGEASTPEQREKQAAVATELRTLAERVLQNVELANRVDQWLKEVRAKASSDKAKIQQNGGVKTSRKGGVDRGMTRELGSPRGCA